MVNPGSHYLSPLLLRASVEGPLLVVASYLLGELTRAFSAGRAAFVRLHSDSVLVIPWALFLVVLSFPVGSALHPRDIHKIEFELS